MRTRYKIGLLCLLFVLMTLLVIFLFNLLGDKEVEVSVLDEIEGYGYFLEDRDSNEYKLLFDELKIELEKEDFSYEKYAELMSQMFVHKFYTLDNRNSIYDVGGSEFIFNDYQENFKINAANTIYKYMGVLEDLPNVSDTTMNNIETSSFDYNEVIYESYNVGVNIEYSKELGYDKEIIVTLIKDDNKLFIVEVKGEEE